MTREHLPPIEHIGILVPNLEQAIGRWTEATGYTFSPIVRYRTDRYADRAESETHHHDARIAFSREGPPRIELMEVTGSGTHGPDQLGVHHFGFQNIDDIEARTASLADTGIGQDGASYDEDGRTLLCFTERSALDGVRLEFVSSLPGPIVADDGSPLPRDPSSGRADIWAGAPKGP